MSAHLGRPKAWHGQLDQSYTVKLDLSDLRHRGRGDWKDLYFSITAEHHARHRMEMAANVPLDSHDHLDELCGDLMLTTDLPAMQSAETSLGSASRWDMYRS